jgi:hypothetical protein
MRGLVIFLIAAFVYGATVKHECSVSEFVNLMYSTNNPKERADKAWDWLDASGLACNKQQLTLIYANLPTLMGSSDSMKIRARIEQLHERASK